MASTASDLIKFEKMATGEKSGTWGTLANVAMSRLEEGFAGYRNITLAGITYVLDDTQYLENSTTTSESHLAVIKATGTPGASRQITAPLRTNIKLYWNAVTTYDMTVAGASGDAVTISNGYMAHVLCDGTNMEFTTPLTTTAGVIAPGAMPAATVTAAGAVELATTAETNTGTDTGRVVTPAGLTAWTGDTALITLGTITTGVWNGTAVALANGGTGASTAAAAATALGVGTGDSPQLTAVNLGHASDTTLARSAAGIMTVEGSVVKTAGTETIWVPASAMYPCSTNGCATLAQVETTAQQPEFKVLDFDKDSDEFAQFTVAFPKSWNAGTVTFRVFWIGLAATTGVAWTLAGRSVADNAEAIGAFGTAVVVQDDSQGDATEVLISATSSAVTITGVADDTLTFFQISRDVSDGNDDMAGDARLTGIQIFYTTNATDDA